MFPNLFQGKLIHKLWEQLAKTLRHRQTKPHFSEAMKTLVNGLLLGEIKTLNAVAESAWLSETSPVEEIEKELEEMERVGEEASAKRKKKQNDRVKLCKAWAK